MSEKLSTNEQVRRLIVAGYSNKHVVEKLGVKPQIVYNMRYQINKSRGLGAIPLPAEDEETGINVSRSTNISTVVTPDPEPAQPVSKWRAWVNKVVGWFTWR
jgi:hypothetical protein